MPDRYGKEKCNSPVKDGGISLQNGRKTSRFVDRTNTNTNTNAYRNTNTKKERKGIVSRISLQNESKSFPLHVMLFALFQSLIFRTIYFATIEGKAGGL